MAKYIEREALLRYLNDIWLTTTPTDYMPDDDRQLAITRCMGLNDAMDAVKDAPAADVVPVRHGKWVELGKYSDGYNWRCSVCKRESVMAVNYCPFCGALMDKDGDGE